MSTATETVENKADAAVAETQEDGKRKRKVKRNRKSRTDYHVPEGGIDTHEVPGFSPKDHKMLEEKDFKGGKLMYLKFQRWLHERAISEFDDKISAIEQLDTVVQDSMCKVIDNISDAAKNLIAAKQTAEAELTPEKAAANNAAMAKQLQELAKKLLESGKAN